MIVYLHYNSSAPIDSRVLDFMIDIYKNHIGNADSRTHDFGNHARQIVADARKQIAHLLGVDSTEVFFTSGATESSNIILQGLQDYANVSGKKHIITTTIEHHAILNTCKMLEKHGFTVDYVNPEKNGRIDANEILSKVRDDTLLVAVMNVNNETGVIQPVQEIGEQLENKDVFFYVDATQSAGKLVDEVSLLKYDMLSFSAHKLEGPQGIGVLVLRKKNYRLPPVKPIMYGGQQEHGLRPGTTPVALVGGLGKSCEIAEKEYRQNSQKAKQIKAYILDALKQSGVKYKINGDQEHCIPSAINITFDGVSSEALMLATKQYLSISNESACNSKSYEPSYVLKAMGLKDDDLYDSVRMSWGPQTDPDAVEENWKKLLMVVKSLQ